MKNFRNLFLGIGIAAALLVLYGYRLDFPHDVYYDEVYHVKQARDIAAFKGYAYIEHPPLGRILIALGIHLFGDKSWVWRIFPLIAGVGIIFAVYFLARLLTGNARIALFSAFLMALDCVTLTQSRIAMLNTPALLFMLLSVICLAPYAVGKKGSRRKALIGTGIFFGLGAACKITSLFIAGPLAFLWIKILIDEKDKPALLKETLLGLGLALGVYFLSYSFIPFMKGKSWIDIWRAQVKMFSYHLHLKEAHRYGSEWWSWPLLIRPIWYYFKRAGSVWGILSIGNPAIFWMIFPAIGYGSCLWVERKSFTLGFLLFSFFASWLPYALGTRVKFFHYFVMVVPFGVMILASALDHLWKSGKIGRAAALGYLILTAGMFIYWYPLLTGYPVSEAYFRHHLWFKSWV